MSAHALAARHSTGAATSRTVNSSDEFSPLREVIVGNPANARIPDLTDRSAWLNLFADRTAPQLLSTVTGPFSPRVVEETAEDVNALTEVLTSLGVTVHQAQPPDTAATFGTIGWSAQGFSAYCPRDLTLVVGNVIIETPSPMRARYFENFAYRHVFRQYLLNGSVWISAPHPQLDDSMFPLDPNGMPMLGEAEPTFEAANILRCGRDLFYQVSASGNEMGLLWLESTLRSIGDFKVHPLRGVYPYTHIDSTISLLRPGLMLLNPSRVTLGNLPQKFRNWDIIWCPPMNAYETATADALSSEWIGMNLLMTSPDTAIVDAGQPDLHRALEAKGITVIPHAFRHARTLGGGIHCATLDTVREGTIEDYFA